MSQINYDLMSDAELKRFFREHPEDKAAFWAYMDRRNQRPKKVIAKWDDPDFDEKIQAWVHQKMEANRRNRLQDT